MEPEFCHSHQSKPYYEEARVRNSMARQAGSLKVKYCETDHVNLDLDENGLEILKASHALLKYPRQSKSIERTSKMLVNNP